MVTPPPPSSPPPGQGGNVAFGFKYVDIAGTPSVQVSVQNFPLEIAFAVPLAFSEQFIEQFRTQFLAEVATGKRAQSGLVVATDTRLNGRGVK